MFDNRVQTGSGAGSKVRCTIIQSKGLEDNPGSWEQEFTRQIPPNNVVHYQTHNRTMPDNNKKRSYQDALAALTETLSICENDLIAREGQLKKDRE